MLEEEIKRLTVAVLDLTAVIKEMNAKPPTMFLSGGIDPAMLDRIKQGPTGAVYLDTVSPAPAPAAAKAYADVAKEVEAHAEAIAPYVASEYTADDARKALMKVAAAKGKDAAAAVLKQFSASKVTELAQQHWPEFIAACEGAL